MEIGISTASLFLRCYNEEAVSILDSLDARVCEVFLQTFCEYKKEFGELINKNKGNLKVHSVHTITNHMDADFFSLSQRTVDEVFKNFKGVMELAQTVGAKYYTFHGKTRMKKNCSFLDYELYGQRFNDMINFMSKYGVSLCLENVEWAFYNKVGFYSEVKKFCPNLKATLDIKQARISGDSYIDYLNEMGSDIMTVHLSDIDDYEKMILPSIKGQFNFEDLFKRLKDFGFDGAMLLEVYKDNFKDYEELKNSLNYLREIQYKIF